MMMYCVMLMSVICVVVLKLGGPFLIGLIVFLSFGWIFCAYSSPPAFWILPAICPRSAVAGMGRAMNNVSAALLANASVALLVSDSNGMASIILALVLFVAVSVVIYLYTAWMPVSSGAPKDIPQTWTLRKRSVFCRSCLSLRPRETEVFDKLVNSEESIQEIADGLYLSRRTCQRHIAAIYEKAGVKSRMGLYQLYIEKQRRL